MSEPAGQRPVAIVGMAGLFPGAPDLPTYWSNILAGVDAITEMPTGRVDLEFYDPESWKTPAYDRVYAWRGGFVDDDATFDPVRYGVMPNAVDTIEPDQLIALRIASAAIDDAGGIERIPDRERVGVVFGRGGYIGPGMSRLSQRVSTSRQVMTILKQLVPGIEPDQLEAVRNAFSASFGPDAPGSAIGIVPNLTASRVANRLDLSGPAYTVDAACASSLLAVEQGIRDLDSGRCDMVLAGGVHHSHDVTLWAVFCQLRALSPSQQIRPFDRRADGLLIGEGTGVLALKRLDDAVRDEDRIYAVIRGTGVASDGRATSLMAPQSSGQVLAVRQAWRAAGLDPTAPGAIGVLEAHGTGTPAGDAAELTTMREVFGDAAGAPIVLGSVKSMIGHAMPAAGVAGLIKAAYAIHHATLPPTLHCEEPHDLLDGSRFRMIGTPEPWESDGPRRAGVNAFGFGGINAHVLLEEAPVRPATGGVRRQPLAAGQTAVGAEVRVDDGAQRSLGREVVLRLAAGSPAEVATLLDGAAAQLGEGGLHGPGGPCRLAIVDPTPERLALAGKIVARGRPWRGRNRVWWTAAPILAADPAAAGQIAFVFPGIERPFESASADVAAHFGLPGASVERTGYPIVDQTLGILTVGQLLTAALGRLGIAPALVAGHSIGEWAAMLVSDLMPSGSLDTFAETLRGQTLEIPGVVFGALSCSAARAAEAIAGMPPEDRRLVDVSHDNCPEQSIVCGEETVVTRLLGRLQGHGVLGQILPFRSGFHSPMLEPFIEPFRRGIAAVPLGRPRFPVWSATTLAPYPEDESELRALLVRHLLEPVRFRELVECLHAAGVRAFVQVGPGSVAGFVDDTLRGREYTAIGAHASGDVTGMAQLHRVAAALWVDGAEPDFAPLELAAPRPAEAAPATAALASTESARVASATAAAATPGAAHDGPKRASPGTARRVDPIRLDLCLPLIRLGSDVRPLELANSDSAAGVRARAITDAAADNPLLAELDAVLEEAAAASYAVLGASTANRWAPGTAPPQPARAYAPSPPSPRTLPPHTRTALPLTGAAVPVGPLLPEPAGSASGAPPMPAGGASAPPAEPATTRTVTRPISVDAMPYLIDHGLFPQRPGWPIVADWGPVVPMTTMIQMMLEEAVAFAPGRIAVGIESITALTWLAATPPTTVTIRTAAAGPDRVSVSLAGHAHATVVLADAYASPPEPSTEPLVGETASDITARQLYDDGWLFHGPAFQGITGIDAMADDGMRTTITAPHAPGALLDNAGQAVGYWLGRHVDTAKLAFPRTIGRISYFGPQPRPGEQVGCTLWIREVLDRAIRADLELRGPDGRVWAAIENWEDYRFGTDATSWPVIDKPGVSCAAVEQPGGWSLIQATWDPSLRQMMMRRYLTQCERGDYERLLPRAEGAWLLGRIAAKDAARRWLWAKGSGPIYPAEIVLANDPSGRPTVSRPTVTGPLPIALAISLSHCGDVAVAMVRPDEPGDWSPGIDIERIEPRDASFEAVAFTTSERRLLDRVAEDGARPSLVTRFWAAKEAVAKARGTGLEGRPRDYVVVGAQRSGEALRVEHGGQAFDVASTELPGNELPASELPGNELPASELPGTQVAGAERPGDVAGAEVGRTVSVGGTHVVAWVVGPAVPVGSGTADVLEPARNRDAS